MYISLSNMLKMSQKGIISALKNTAYMHSALLYMTTLHLNNTMCTLP